MMSWDFDKTDDNKVEFTKFPEGVTTIRVVDTVPHVRWTHWMPKNMRSITCPGFKTCPICEIRQAQKANGEQYTHNMGRRLAIQIINRNTGKLEIMEQGVTVFNDLKDLMEDLAEKNKKLIDVDISVRRRGMGKDSTSYRLDIGEESILSPADVKLLDEKLDLKEFFVEHTPEQIIAVLNGADWNETMYPKDDAIVGDIDDEIEDEVILR